MKKYLLILLVALSFGMKAQTIQIDTTKISFNIILSDTSNQYSGFTIDPTSLGYNSTYDSIYMVVFCTLQQVGMPSVRIRAQNQYLVSIHSEPFPNYIYPIFMNWLYANYYICKLNCICN